MSTLAWVDREGKEEPLGAEPHDYAPFEISPDEKKVAFSFTTGGNMDMYIWDIRSGTQTRLTFDEGEDVVPRWSRDSQWMAYESNESGKYEVYVRSFPDVNKGKWQISENGGNSPLWSPYGTELFYRSGNSFMAVVVKTEPTFEHGKPEVLFKRAYHSMNFPFEFTNWDISPDGKRFLILKPVPKTGFESTEQSATRVSSQINIVLNWFEELKDRVPTD